MNAQHKKSAVKLGNARKITKSGFVGVLPEVENPVLFYNM